MICQTLWIKELQRPFMIMFCQRLFPFFVVMQAERIWLPHFNQDLSCVGFDFSFKEIQSSSGLLLSLWIYYPKFFIESLVDICLLCVENCRDLFFTFRDLCVIFLASHLKTASKFGNVWRSRVAVFEVNSFLWKIFFFLSKIRCG